MLPVKPKKLYENIVDRVLHLIQTGALRSGDKLPTEKEMAQEMSVSKTAVREAMSALESMGYTKSRVGEGTFVADITLDSLMLPVSIVLAQEKAREDDLLELRLILEVRSAELAAQRITPAQMQRLGRLLEAMRREVEAGGTACDADVQFHKVLASGTGNSVFCRIYEMCQTVLVETISMVMNYPGQARMAYEKHLEIYNAVRNGDSLAAAEAMRRHLTHNSITLGKIQKEKKGAAT